jgi:hypothetical protein
LVGNPTRGEKNSKRRQETSDGGTGGRADSSLTEKKIQRAGTVDIKILSLYRVVWSLAPSIRPSGFL